MGELTLRLPLDENPKISSPYGLRTLRSTGERKFHFGTDYEAKVGTFVRASESGEVIRAAWHKPEDPKAGSLGELVIIDHTPKAKRDQQQHIYTLYGHLSSYSVKRGDRVNKGDEVGLSGDTGTSTGPHLHFAVVDAGSKLVWGTSGATGVTPTTSQFKDPETYVGRTISVEGTLDDFTDEEMGKLHDMIETDFKTGSRPTLLVRMPEYREFLRKIGREPFEGETPPKIKLKFENMFSPAFRSFFTSVDLEVNGRNFGNIQTGTKVYELNVWG